MKGRRQQRCDGWSHDGLTRALHKVSLSRPGISRGGVAHGVRVNSVALGDGKVFMRRAPDIFGVRACFALRDPRLCSTRAKLWDWDTSGRCKQAAAAAAVVFCWDSGAGRSGRPCLLSLCVLSC